MARWRSAAAPTAIVGVLVLAAMTGCATGGSPSGVAVPSAGAPASGHPTGPAVWPAPPVASAPAVGSAPTRPPDLRTAIVDALTAEDPTAASGLKLEQRPYAQDQLIVTWFVTRDPDDAAASTLVRREAIGILDAVQRSATTSYGSVLLIAYATVRDASGARTNAKVVRAKYSAELVERTDFAAVSVDQILDLPDDKPAEIHPSYR